MIEASVDNLKRAIDHREDSANQANNWEVHEVKGFAKCRACGYVHLVNDVPELMAPRHMAFFLTIDKERTLKTTTEFIEKNKTFGNDFANAIEGQKGMVHW